MVPAFAARAAGTGPPPGSRDPYPYPEELVREAVARDGSRCSVCGRPCNDREAWRRSEPGPLGDSPDNFSAMCIKCALFLSREGVKPARYIAYSYNPSRARWLMTRLAIYAGLLLFLTFYAMFSVFVYLVIFRWTRHDPSSTAGTLFISIFVVSVAVYLVLGAWRFGRRAWAELAASWRAVARGVVWRSGADE